MNRIVYHQIFVHVNCPGVDNDTADTAVRHATAVDLFRRQCPLGVSVEGVVMSMIGGIISEEVAPKPSDVTKRNSS